MLAFYIILGVVLWIAVAFWPARVASDKGYNFWLYFFISIPFFFVTLFLVYFLPDRRGGPEDSSLPD